MTRENVIMTDFGSYPVPKSVAIVMDAAKLRTDGTYDQRTAAFRFLVRYQAAANEVAAKAYVESRKKVPVMPEANDI